MEKTDIKSMDMQELQTFVEALGEKKFRAKQDYRIIQKTLKTMTGALIEVRTKQDKGTILTVKVPKKGYIIKE